MDIQQKPQHHASKWRARNRRKKSEENERKDTDTKSTEVRVAGKNVENKKREKILVKVGQFLVLEYIARLYLVISYLIDTVSDFLNIKLYTNTDMYYVYV